MHSIRCVPRTYLDSCHCGAEDLIKLLDNKHNNTYTGSCCPDLLRVLRRTCDAGHPASMGLHSHKPPHSQAGDALVIGPHQALPLQPGLLPALNPSQGPAQQPASAKLPGPGAQQPAMTDHTATFPEAAGRGAGGRKGRGPGKGWRRGVTAVRGRRGRSSNLATSSRGRGGRTSDVLPARKPGPPVLGPGSAMHHPQRHAHNPGDPSLPDGEELSGAQPAAAQHTVPPIHGKGPSWAPQAHPSSQYVGHCDPLSPDTELRELHGQSEDDGLDKPEMLMGMPTIPAAVDGFGPHTGSEWGADRRHDDSSDEESLGLPPGFTKGRIRRAAHQIAAAASKGLGGQSCAFTGPETGPILAGGGIPSQGLAMPSHRPTGGGNAMGHCRLGSSAYGHITQDVGDKLPDGLATGTQGTGFQGCSIPGQHMGELCVADLPQCRENCSPSSSALSLEQGFQNSPCDESEAQNGQPGTAWDDWKTDPGAAPRDSAQQRGPAVGGPQPGRAARRGITKGRRGGRRGRGRGTGRISTAAPAPQPASKDLQTSAMNIVPHCPLWQHGSCWA